MTKAKTLRAMYGRMLRLFYWNVMLRAVYDELSLGEIDGYESRIAGSGHDAKLLYVLIEFIDAILHVRKGDGAWKNLNFRASELRRER